MPIRPENAARYPKEWPAISARIRQRAGNRCEDCGVENYAKGARNRDGRWCPALPTGTDGMRTTWPHPSDHAWCEGIPEKVTIVRIVLTVAHLDHHPENCTDDNLRCWCQRCHNRYDAATRSRGIRERAKASRAVGDLFAEAAE